MKMKTILKNHLLSGLTLSSVLLATALPGWAQAATGKPAYLQGMQTVAAGGTTSESVTPAKIDGLKQLGNRRLRIINVDRGTLQAIGADGKATVNWPVQLTYPLKVCKQNGFVPHIVIGHYLPPQLAAGGRKGGPPTSWAQYDRFIDAYLNYVVVEQGFKETEWEVGNEMNIVTENWMATQTPAASTDEAGFNAYAILYSHVARDIDNFRRQHPGTIMRVGGPAEAEDVHLPPPQDWTTRLIRYTAANHLPIDYVSFHAYGNAATGAKYGELINEIRKEINENHSSATIFVTEWGPSYDNKPGLNYDPIAGAFALDFAAKMALFAVHDTMFLSLSQLPNNDWPAYYKLDGSPSHPMLALLAIAGLKGDPIPCVGTAGGSCVAVKDSTGDVDVVFWNYDWTNEKFPSRMPNKGPQKQTFTLTGSGLSDSYDLASGKMNSAAWQGGGSTSNFARGNGSNLSLSVVMPYGNYGEVQLKPH